MVKGKSVEEDILKKYPSLTLPFAFLLLNFKYDYSTRNRFSGLPSDRGNA
jgi:hypothetical protein